MTRKTLFIIAILACMLSPLSAFDYRLDLISLTPLYEEYDADNHRASLDFQYGAIYQGYPEGFYQNDTYFPFVDSEVLRIRPFVATYHMGETLSLLKNTFTFDHWLSPIAFDFAFQGSLTGVLEGEVADTIGYDGEYFFGMTMSIADVLSFRFGGSHYCSHYGDGSYKVIATGGGVPSNFDEWFKYLRMDSMIFGLSIQPVDFVRVYAEIDFATKDTSVLPYYFEPEWGRASPTAAPPTRRARSSTAKRTSRTPEGQNPSTTPTGPGSSSTRSTSRRRSTTSCPSTSPGTMDASCSTPTTTPSRNT